MQNATAKAFCQPYFGEYWSWRPPLFPISWSTSRITDRRALVALMGKRTIHAILAQPRGFCAGVERAIRIVEATIERYGAPVYVRHEIVHNRRVVEELRAKGAVFVENIDQIPVGAVTIFSAHGVSSAVENSARIRDLSVIDATCPLVEKVHKEAQKFAAQGRKIVLIGHRGHPEVEGTSGRVKGGVVLVSSVSDVESLDLEESAELAYVTQTTLSVDDTREIIKTLRQRFPNITGPNLRDICYATQNRQSAARDLANRVDVLLVIGATTSSNSNRLRDIGEEMSVPSYLIEDAGSIDPKWLEGAERVGITAGASAPEKLVQEVIQYLRGFAMVETETLPGIVESIQFKLPAELKTK